MSPMCSLKFREASMPEAHFPRISPLRFSVKGITLLYYYLNT